MSKYKDVKIRYRAKDPNDINLYRNRTPNGTVYNRSRSRSEFRKPRSTNRRRSQSSQTRYVRGRSVFRDYSPGNGFRNRSRSRGYRRSESNNEMKEVKTKLAEIISKVDSSGIKSAMEIKDMFKNSINDMWMDRKSEVQDNKFAKCEQTENQEGPIIENNVKLVYAEEKPGLNIMDCGAPKTCGSVTYVKEYLKGMNLDIEKMPRVKTNDVFVFGSSRFPTLGKIVIPIKYKNTKGKKVYKETECHLINHNIGILIGLQTMQSWGAWLGTEFLQVKIRGETPEEEHVIKGFIHGGHFVIPTYKAEQNEKFEIKEPTRTNTRSTHNLLLIGQSMIQSLEEQMENDREREEWEKTAEQVIKGEETGRNLIQKSQSLILESQSLIQDLEEQMENTRETKEEERQKSQNPTSTSTNTSPDKDTQKEVSPPRGLGQPPPLNKQEATKIQPEACLLTGPGEGAGSSQEEGTLTPKDSESREKESPSLTEDEESESEREGENEEETEWEKKVIEMCEEDLETSKRLKEMESPGLTEDEESESEIEDEEETEWEKKLIEICEEDLETEIRLGDPEMWKVTKNKEDSNQEKMGEIKQETEEEWCVCEIKKKAEKHIKNLDNQKGKEAKRVQEKFKEIKERIEEAENVVLLTHEEKVQGIKRVHEQSGHKQEDNLAKVLKGAEVCDRKVIQEVISKCGICQKNQKGKETPKVSTVRPKSFNEVLTVDLKINIKNGKHILWMIDPFSRYTRGVELKNKTAEEVVNAIENEWFYIIGCPKNRLWGDNGTEFCNKEMKELCDKWNIQFSAGPPYSPWSNGLNERNHHSCDIVVKKLLMEEPGMKLQSAINKAAWVHNTNLTKNGYAPLTTMSGQPIKLPTGGLQRLKDEEETMTAADQVERVLRIQRMFMEAEADRMVMECIKRRVPGFKHEQLEKGDKVLVRLENKKIWEGPYKVDNPGDGLIVVVDVEGELRDIGRMRVSKWYEWEEKLKEEPKKKEENKKDEEKEKIASDRITRSMNKKKVHFPETLLIKNTQTKGFQKAKKKEEEEKPEYGYIEIPDEDEYLSSVLIMETNERESEECQEAMKEELERLEEMSIGEGIEEWKVLQAGLELLDIKKDLSGCSIEDAREEIANVLITELAKKDWGSPEAKVAIEKEINNMKEYGVFGERIKERLGIEIIGTRLILTESQKQDGQKTKIKARVVVQGFKASEKVQSDSPTAHRESMRMFLAICTMLSFKNLSSIDITGAYLQSEDLSREIYVRLPEEFEKDKSMVYKLKKPLYGLSDAGRQFWLKVTKIFKENGYKAILGDDCMFRKVDENGKLEGLVIIHVDDFIYNGSDRFVDEFQKMVSKELKISKVEKGKMRFCGVDYIQTEDGIVASMEDYCESIQEYPQKLLDREKKQKDLTEEQKTVLRGIAGQINWLAQICRPDLAYGGHQLSIRSSSGKIEDLKYANSIVKKAKSRPSKIVYKNIGNPEDSVIYGFTDANYKSGEKSKSGQMIFLGNMSNDKVVPILWKTKLIQKTCRSAKDAETISLEECADMATFSAQQVEEIIYGVRNGSKFKTLVFTDSESSIASTVSSKQVDRRCLRSYVQIMKDHLIEKTVDKIVWVSDKKMIADILTKEKATKEGLDEMLRDGRLRCVKDRKMYVFHDGKDFVTIGKALKDAIFKQNSKIPIRKKLAKTHTTIEKAKKEEKEMEENEKMTEKEETDDERGEQSEEEREQDEN